MSFGGNNTLIDGNPVIASGTLVVAAGTQAKLNLPFGLFTLIFNPELPTNIQLSTNPMQIKFDGTDNPLGISSSFNLPLANNVTMRLVLAVYSIGEGSNATRIVHYTVS
ncbi:hypothetical protein [Acetobacter sp. DsW_063]|uniref:hypothetical protein n=1 Tax=Acetobacter sp. DsW_063 TaxID=1514894 RepID=UPI0011775D6E|nr:hypothetical protein [Acetobacter sp. DsW_063]